MHAFQTGAATGKHIAETGVKPVIPVNGEPALRAAFDLFKDDASVWLDFELLSVF